MSDPSSSTATPHWWGEVAAVFLKDLRSELRTPSAISTLGMFVLTTTVLVSLTVVTTGPGLDMNALDGDALKEAVRTGARIYFPGQTLVRAQLLSAFFWIILYFGALTGIPRVFTKEEEQHTAVLLRLVARPSAIFAGKLIFNVILLELVAAAVTPVYLLLLQPVIARPFDFGAHIFVGTASISGTATLIGAMVSRSGNRGYLAVILGLGPLLPVLVAGINGTAAAMQGTGGNYVLGLVSYLGMMTALSALLFEKVWRD